MSNILKKSNFFYTNRKKYDSIKSLNRGSYMAINDFYENLF